MKEEQRPAIHAPKAHVKPERARINWPEGVIPSEIDGIMPLSSIELKLARGTYNPSDTESMFPCPDCGFALGGMAIRSSCKRGCKIKLTYCDYCRVHNLAQGSVKIEGGECTICGPTKVFAKGGKHPQRKVVTKQRKDGSIYQTEDIVYDLETRLDWPGEVWKR